MKGALCGCLVRQISLCRSQTFVSKTNYNMKVATGLRMMSTKSKFEVINIQDEEDFKKKVAENVKPVVVDFHAKWCGPCKLLAPRLETIIAGKEGKVVLAKVDIDENADLAMHFSVMSVPTVVGMKGGKKIDQFIGLQEDDIIEGFVDKLIH